MAHIFLWSLRVFTALLVVLAGMAGLAYMFAARSLPDYDAARTVPGLTGAVEIVRDNSGVPHIFAEAERDVHLNHPHCAKFCVLGGASCSV